MDAAGWEQNKCYATHLSVILCLFADPFDDNLSWPLRGEFEVNQMRNTDHTT